MIIFLPLWGWRSEGANLLSNGSFEAPGFSNAVSYITSTNNDIVGWSASSPSSRNIAVHKTPDVGAALGAEYNFAQEGNYYVDLSGNGTNHPTLSQGFPTWQGFDYVLSFYYGAATNSPSAVINVQIYDERTNLNVTLTPMASTNGNILWTRYEFIWTAHANNTVLRFRDISTQDDNSSFIDNVSVMPYPSQLGPFRIVSLTYGPHGLGGPIGWIITWESTPSFTYQVFYKNTLSDESWTPLGQPFIPSASPNPSRASFVDTTTNGASQRYYRVIGE